MAAILRTANVFTSFAANIDYYKKIVLLNIILD